MAKSAAPKKPVDDFDLDDDSFNLASGGFDLGGQIAGEEPDGVSLISNDFDGDLDEPDEPTFERAAAQEMGETLTRMHATSDAAKARFHINTDTDYLAVVVFLSHEQREEFMNGAGWNKHAGGGGRYVNGVSLAREMGVEITPVKFKPFEPKA